MVLLCRNSRESVLFLCLFTADVKERERNNLIAMLQAEMNGAGQKGETMKNKEAKNLFRRGSLKVPLNLQYYAEEGGDGSGSDGDGKGEDSGGDNDGGDGGGKEPTFDEILAAGHQAEFDRRVQKAITTAVTNAQEKWRVMTDDKVSEAEKLAKMTASERTEYLQQKKEKELTAKEAEITKRELMAEAKNTLTEKNIPLELAEVLNYTDADSCNRSISAIEKAFQSAVEKAVEERLKGGEPPQRASGNEEKALEEQIAKAMSAPF